MVNIKGLSRASVLAALYNHSKPLGLGFLHYNPEKMTEKEAEELLKKETYFDYLRGRVMKVDLSNENEFREYLYDRDNGQGAAQGVIDRLLERVIRQGGLR